MLRWLWIASYLRLLFIWFLCTCWNCSNASGTGSGRLCCSTSKAKVRSILWWGGPHWRPYSLASQSCSVPPRRNGCTREFSADRIASTASVCEDKKRGSVVNQANCSSFTADINSAFDINKWRQLAMETPVEYIYIYIYIWSQLLLSELRDKAVCLFNQLANFMAWSVRI